MLKPLLLSCVVAAALTSSLTYAAPAKNVIFFLGDGMGPTTLTAARIYKYGEAGNLQMQNLPYTARLKTYSNDAQTTDSAPSMSSYMTGLKMNNEVISMSTNTTAVAPGKDSNGNKTVNNCTADNGTPATTLLELAKAQGKGTGSITTTELTHATPAATFAHICHRDAQYEIAAQTVPGGAGFNSALGDGVDVLMGGGANHWTPYSATNTKGRADGRDLTAELQTHGYSYVTDKTALQNLDSSKTTKLLGLFSKTSHLAYELDRVADSSNQQPSLAEMTSKAIDILSKNDKGYFLMVEGGRIDHALHGTNAKRALEDTVALDEAIKTALSKVDLTDTLVVVTADHDHTMTMNGYSAKGNPILGLVTDKDGIQATDVDGRPYTTLVFGNGSNRPGTRPDLTSEQVQANDYLQEAGIRLASETHGGGDVMLFADGAGAKTFKGTMENTAVFSLVKAAAGY